ncbi:MAG TPA: hypothetical protein VGP93_04780 [Polyangiaceae bacterium]|jgi:hypothetical protein|nr:hypothetical protein [Polyangiaceae bacterium]
MRRSWPVTAVSLAFALACGEQAPKNNQDSPDGGASARESVLSSCAEFAARLCASAEPCCTTTTGTFDAEACAAQVMSEVCRPAADAVEAGFASYHPEAVEDCLAAHAVSHQVCMTDWSQLLELRRGIWSACKVIRGTVEPGRGCTSATTCAQPDGPSVARCVAGKCQLLEILPEGATCPYPNGEVSVCDEGLYCTTTERDVSGVCQRATAQDEPCDPIPLNPECGLGRYCDLDAGVCRSATNFGGPTCQQGPECVSFICEQVSGECTVPLATVAALCPVL